MSARTSSRARRSLILAQVEQVEVVREIVARRPTGPGAARVVPFYSDRHVRRAAIEFGPEEMLGVSPTGSLDMATSWDDSRPAIISLSGAPEPGIFDGLDSGARRQVRRRPTSGDLPAAHHRAQGELGDRRRPDAGLGADGVRRAGRRAALAGRRDGDAARRRPTRWRPGASRPRSSRRARRSSNERRFDAIRYRGPGTDLRSGSSRMRAGCARPSTTENGIEHLPEHPDRGGLHDPRLRRAEGTVRSTYPLWCRARRDGTGLEFTLRGGRIVETRADGDGAAVIERQLGARRAGAVPRRARARHRRLGDPRERHRLPRHALRRERELPHRLRQRAALRRRRRGRARRRRAARAGRQRLAGAHRLHDRRPRARGRRPRRRGRRDADHPRGRLGPGASLSSACA